MQNYFFFLFSEKCPQSPSTVPRCTQKTEFQMQTISVTVTELWFVLKTKVLSMFSTQVTILTIFLLHSSFYHHLLSAKYVKCSDVHIWNHKFEIFFHSHIRFVEIAEWHANNNRNQDKKRRWAMSVFSCVSYHFHFHSIFLFWRTFENICVWILAIKKTKAISSFPQYFQCVEWNFTLFGPIVA